MDGDTTKRLKYSAEQFSSKTIESLYDQIKAIDDRVIYKLTPLVRDPANEAVNPKHRAYGYSYPTGGQSEVFAINKITSFLCLGTLVSVKP